MSKYNDNDLLLKGIKEICDSHECPECPLFIDKCLASDKERTIMVLEGREASEADSFLNRFIKAFPNAKIHPRGFPDGICPDHIEKDFTSNFCGKAGNGPDNCFKCWSQPYVTK